MVTRQLGKATIWQLAMQSKHTYPSRISTTAPLFMTAATSTLLANMDSLIGILVTVLNRQALSDHVKLGKGI